MMIWLFLVALLIAISIWYHCTKTLKYWADAGANQTKPFILFGDMLGLTFRKLDTGEWLNWVYNCQPNTRYIGYYQMTVPNLMIKDPELIKQLTVKDFDHFTDHQQFFTESDPLWSKNLFALKGQKWRDMRTTLSGSFTSSKMKYMYNVIVSVIDDFIDYFVKKNKDLVEVELTDLCPKLTNDIVATTAFGVKVDTMADPNNIFYIRGKEATNFSGFLINLKFFVAIMFPKLVNALGMKFFSKRVSDFFNILVKDTITTREQQGIVRPDMINILLEARKEVQKKSNKTDADSNKHQEENYVKRKTTRLTELTYADIASQAMVFFFAGFDSVSRAMCFTMYELACNVDVQNKLREEIMETLKECDGKITYDALLKMKYLDMVVSESLRLWPPAPVTERMCTKAYIIQPKRPGEKPVHIQVGDQIMLPIYSLHMDPKYFPDPEKFTPERFANEEDISPYTYMPFGAGPRICIGFRLALLEIKILMFKMLSKFEIVPTKKTERPLQLTKGDFGLLKPKNGFWVGLKRL